ncbi:hypothetical protein Ocin01_07322 [Orchesella cincta]|uniref:Uncharacterized protein n=1 Tax=Orchesella cincta TaxID=48709 RepID=A0A1D2N2S5_ORCCI|nr:hypothetical protein Ocin01_07322 [Orchesella cincta]
MKLALANTLGVLMTILVIKTEAGILPVQQLLYGYPSTGSQQTTVIRDALGNQGTGYAYQTSNGISSSAVAVSRSDNSKTLAYLPAAFAAAPVVATQPLYAHHQLHHHHHLQPAISVASGGYHVPGVAYSDYNTYV